jgi:hypothetical protein
MRKNGFAYLVNADYSTTQCSEGSDRLFRRADFSPVFLMLLEAGEAGFRRILKT